MSIIRRHQLHCILSTISFILQNKFYFFIKFLERNPKMALNKLKVCLIGAGPSGMSVMYHLNKLAVAGKQIPQIKCYEKQSACGGLWNYSWRTGNLFILSFGKNV